MKKQTNIQKKAKSQNRQGIKDASNGSYQGIIHVHNKVKTTPSDNWRRHAGGFNIFLIQNMGKDPPGRVRCPGALNRLRPDNQPAVLKNNKTSLITDFQMFKQIQKP